MQSHVSQLRRFLGEAAVIRLVPPGYVLDLPGDGTDVGVAQRLIREGTTASDAAEGARVLREAIGLWRGRPLAELAGWRWFDEQAWWLESLRAQATRALTEHRLALGDHAALVAELRRMAREQPLDEDLRRQLMLALYRSGRQAESLAAYRELRSQLVTELGIEPGADLRDLEQAILRHDPVLAWKPPEAGAIAAPQPPVPRQLPLAVAAFSGRRREIALLDGLLDQLEHVPTGTGSGAPLIAVVSGTAGDPGPKIGARLGRRQQPAARSVVGSCSLGLTGFGDWQDVGVEAGFDGFEDDLVASPFDGAGVAADFAADVRAPLVVVGAEVFVDGFGVREQFVADDQLASADGALG